MIADANGVNWDIDQLTSREGYSGTRISFDVVTSRSFHPGCANVLFMDGSVHTITNGVDLATWRALGTPAGGEVIGN